MVSSDLTGDGPTDDDLIGGIREPLTLNEESLTIDITLSDDHDWLENLPWYSKGEAADGQ